MNIRLSEKNDINGMISLWNEAFGDAENEICFFLDNKYISENTLIIEENGKIASMLFLLEGNMRIKAVSYPSYYLYAACTAEEFRGRGFMAELLAEANRIAFSRGKDFICLMPGEKSLFEFYEKHGYVTAFSKKILTVKRKDCDYSSEFRKIAVNDYQKLRNNAFSEFDYFEWDNRSVEFAFSHNRMYSGQSLETCKGYVLYNIKDDTASVKEFAFADKNCMYGLSSLFSASGCNKAVICLPVDYKSEIGEYEIAPSAMLYPVSDRSKSIAATLKNAYLGLTLD
ncbi:MAG: GNAT family N-acetyltransferase [Clostridia bacterium]|nr:GNAT family N-acetyltransferase [Clostridia bacterium]